MVQFGSRLKELRTERNFTQKQLADRIGLAISAISSYESGNRYPSYEVLLQLSRIFHVSTDYLLGVEYNRTIDVSGLNENEIDVIHQMVKILRNNK